MGKLIRLEWKKNGIGKYIRNTAILAVVLCLFIFALAFLGIANDPDGTLDAAPGMNTISSSIELFTSIEFLIFTSTMLASFIVSSYKNKTMNLMFSYPIKRQRILAAQMLAVWLFNFVASVLTKISIYLCVAVGARYMASSFFLDFHMGSISFYLSLLLKSAVVVSMSFIALFVGMALKSSKATIITSFFLIFLTQANVGDFTLANQMAVPIGLTVVSLGCAFGVVESAEKRELR